jgi:hypothetical protein
MATSKQNMKRIHKVVIKRMLDESPDTSWLGEYDSHPTSDYSIDRAHSEDCASVNSESTVEQLERGIAYLSVERTAAGNDPENIYWSSLDGSIDTLIEAQENVAECDCGFSGHWNNREFRYFNPSRNYNGEKPEDIRKYVAQDYARVEDLNACGWCFIGIRAEAEYSVGESRNGYLGQDITSGGLWGIESDSEESYFTSVENEELADLAVQLKGIGFSGRAIASAFKNVERKES